MVEDLASNAFGNQRIEATCVAVGDTATGTDGSRIAAARIRKAPGCVEQDLLWVFVQDNPGGAWTESFLGPAPACWKGVPDPIADAVAEASGIPGC